MVRTCLIASLISLIAGLTPAASNGVAPIVAPPRAALVMQPADYNA
jgi:hypothetical protein